MEDLLGRYLSDAERILNEQGERFEIIETSPPQGNRETENRKAEGLLRVIRQDNKNGATILTVCRISDAYR
jgi:hypothetical protein